MPLPLAISPRAPGMRKAPRAPALIASPRLAQRGTPRLCAALAAAVALPSVADAAHHHLRMAACTHEQASTDRPGNGPGRRSSSRHRRSGSSPENALRNEPNRRCRPSPWTSSPAGAILRTHSWLTRWGAAVGTTARSSRLPRPFYNWRSSIASSPRRPDLESHQGVWGEPPGKAFVIQDKPAAAISAAPHASRVLHRGHATNAARAPCRPSASNRANALTPPPGLHRPRLQWVSSDEQRRVNSDERQGSSPLLRFLGRFRPAT